MPETRFSIPFYEKDCPVIGCPVFGSLAAQRTALDQLLDKEQWPKPEREATGRPRMGSEFCSLTHGGGWAWATRSNHPIGIDVEATSPRMERVRSRFVGPQDQPVLDWFGDNPDTLCRIWTAKEAAFKVFGTGIDFLTGLRWTEVHDHGAQLFAVQQSRALTLHWKWLDAPKNAVAAEHETRAEPNQVWLALCGAAPD